MFEVTRFDDGSLAGLHLMEDDLSHPPRVEDRVYAGQTEQRLGEQCRVWSRSVVRRRIGTVDPGTFEQSGCTTQDGIELWWRNGRTSMLNATIVERRPVAPTEVHYSLELLDFQLWITADRAASHENDYDVLLEARGETRSFQR